MQTVNLMPTTIPGEPMRNRPRTTYVTALGVSLALLGVACSKKDQQASDTMAASSTAAAADTSASRSLYDRLGGKSAITAVVDTFVARVAADDRINAFFRGIDITHLEQMLTEQICSASGGPCTYTGKSMREVHTGMNLTDDHFNALVSDLVAALNRYNVPAREQSDLLVALSALKPDIVGH